jgi:Holliday junction resolvase
MKYAAKADRNQPEIVAALRKFGAAVIPTHTVGQGFPDLVVAFNGRTFLLEIKDGEKIPSKRRLTPDQEKFHAAWTGEIHVVESIEQALAVTRGNA